MRILEGAGGVDAGLLGETEHALADDVAEHLVGATGDRRGPRAASLDQENVPHSPVSATSRGPRAWLITSAVCIMLLVSAILAIDSSGPGADRP